METIKIAVITEDGETISSHFGMAPYYKVFTVQDGTIVESVTLDKPHHKVHPDHGQHQGHGHGHGRGHDHHDDMFAPIYESSVLLAGGMGQGAFSRAQAAGLEVFFVGGKIDEAMKNYLSQKIVSDARRLHIH